MRYLRLKDLFEIKCKKCGSTDVDLYGSYCDSFGPAVEGTCNNCNNKYDSHEYKELEE